MRQSENRAGAAGGDRRWIAAAAMLGAVSVAGGAFAAHGFDPVSQMREVGLLRTGAQYQGLHALAILAVVALDGRLSRRRAGLARWSFLIGGIIFPVALYGLALTGPGWLGAVAPVGGLAFIVGWLALGSAALERNIGEGD